jgi:prepilin-type N-terminal cleavage/methylation domain-containing protein/prepilin-type processing-associated H-X9-DG protein
MVALNSMRPRCGTGCQPVLRRAFTLIELLVVIAIVALLAALGSVGWQHSQRDARSAACTQNLRTIGAAMARYVGEHDGIYPELAMARATRSDAAPTIDTALASYVGDHRAFACPDDRKHIAEVSGTSYLWNWKLNGQRLVSLSVSFVAISPIDEPGHTMMMGDKEGFHEHLQNKLNVLYADGHVSQELTFLSDTPPKN